MPGIDDACPPPPADPLRPTRPWHRGEGPAGRHDAGAPPLSEVQVESQGKGAPSPSLSPSPAGPCTACRLPRGGGVGISAQEAWRPAASQADVMANSRHLAHPWDF